ncbi:hypothetical protein OS493_019991 [Desmophyllum pertusum]|uniref:WH2 domain-containing protein n=1 Tax=Desmophyllum pertusum TaxID=174260 RepID=A0A9X0CDY7_9CNID|nr:hypothetical protein OS493_019991 [Desmophyllum pertusum]
MVKKEALMKIWQNVFQDDSVMEQDYLPSPVIMPQVENTLPVEKEALISNTINKMSAAGLTPALGNTCSTSPSSTSQSQSPAPGNGRGSFLSQIRQFNKSKLKKLAICPERNTSDQLQSNHTPDELQWTEVRKDSCIQGNGAQESVDATDLLSALNRVMQNRARVLHDTLNSTDEAGTSDDDDEWEL